MSSSDSRALIGLAQYALEAEKEPRGFLLVFVSLRRSGFTCISSSTSRAVTAVEFRDSESNRKEGAIDVLWL
jgi:hypothetical protein